LNVGVYSLQAYTSCWYRSRCFLHCSQLFVWINANELAC